MIAETVSWELLTSVRFEFHRISTLEIDLSRVIQSNKLLRIKHRIEWINIFCKILRVYEWNGVDSILS